MKNFTHFLLKNLMVILTIIMFSGIARAQMPAAISMEPSDATVFDSITLTFNPVLACFQDGSLTGVPIVYMHSGVTTSAGNWQNVIDYNHTGANGQAPQLTPNGDGTYSIGYRPSAFYGIAEGTIVTKLCMVFNDGQWGSKDGRDFDPANPPNCMDFFIPLKFSSSEPKFKFTVNMEKMVNEGLFDPIADAVYANLLTPTNMEVELSPGIGADQYKFTGMIESGLDSGTTYTYKYRINEADFETVSREITANPGTTAVTAWWNDDPINVSTFMVDMTYWIAAGKFDPDVDVLDMPGSMNGWAGSPDMTPVPGKANLYQVEYTLDPATIYEYKYRINHDWENAEFPGGGPNRMTWGPPVPKTILSVYDNYKPGTLPVTFKCHMSYQIKAGHFDPTTEYLDIAGNLNGWGAYDVLFDRSNPHDSVYQITLNADTNNMGTSPVEFKFRFNGDWNTSEFPGGGPNRKYFLLDTAGGVQNIVEVWYSDLNPNILTPPWAYDLEITGTLIVGQDLTGHYTYENVNGIPEGASTYKWYTADDNQGTNLAEIPGIVTIGYSPTELETGKFLAFEVTPIAASGDSAIGKPVMVYSLDKIGGVGIKEVGNTYVNFYPNPVTSQITFEHLGDIARIEIFSIVGQQVMTFNNLSTEKMTVNTSNLKAGIYFLRFYGKDNSFTTAKFVKN